LFITQYLTIGQRNRSAISIEFVNYKPDKMVTLFLTHYNCL